MFGEEETLLDLAKDGAPTVCRRECEFPNVVFKEKEDQGGPLANRTVHRLIMSTVRLMSKGDIRGSYVERPRVPRKRGLRLDS